MLAVSRDDKNLDCVKILLQAGADFTSKDSYGNTVIHLAAMNGNNKILDYLSKNLKINIFERNKVGDTALSVCTASKNTEGANILE
jgi:ankyrin repeat protein